MPRSSLCFLSVFGLTASLLSCTKEPASLSIPVSSSGNLELIGEYQLSVHEPSGLALSADRKSLWTVSDSDGMVSQMDLHGKVIGSFDTGLKDLEAIEMIDDHTLAVLAERDRGIAIFSTDGKEIRHGKIDIPGSDNKGPEALAYDAAAGQFIIMQEDSGLLIRLDSGFREISRERLNFAMDYSSLTFEPAHNELWVMSDKSQSIHVLNPQLAIRTSYSTNIRQLEGIAIDNENRLLYAVSDPLAKLYVFNLKDN